jgi:hypothetical protein
MPLDKPPPRSNRFGSPLVLSRVHWVRPELVVEVKYLAWTGDNLLRQVVSNRRSPWIAELRFAADSPLEGAVTANSSLGAPNSLLAGKIQGISLILASVARIRGRNGHNNQSLTRKFPTQRNRELIGPYQGIKSAYQGNFLSDQGRVPWLGFPARSGQVLATSVTCTRCSLGELRQRGQRVHRYIRTGNSDGIGTSSIRVPLC